MFSFWNGPSRKTWVVMKTEFEIPCANGKCTLDGCGINRASSSSISAAKWGNQPAAGRVTPGLMEFQMHPFHLLESSEYQSQNSHQHFCKFPAGNRLVSGIFLSASFFLVGQCSLSGDVLSSYIGIRLFSFCYYVCYFCLFVICKFSYFYNFSSFLILIFNLLQLHLRRP